MFKKGSVRENVMFLRDAVHPSERFMAAKRKAHLRQDTTSDRRRSPRIAGRIHSRDPTLPRPCRQDLQSGAHHSDLVNQTDAITPAEIDLMWKTAPPRMPIAAPRNMISSPAKGLN
jgi:hypothetical protein